MRVIDSSMDAILRQRLERMAWNRANAAEGDPRRWLETDGARDFLYCPYATVEDWDFDGDLDVLDLPWDQQRIEEIDGGDDLSEQELREWRQATARRLAETGSGWSSIVWIIPLPLDDTIVAYAAFEFSQELSESPLLHGIYGTVEDAKGCLREKGALVDQ